MKKETVKKAKVAMKKPVAADNPLSFNKDGKNLAESFNMPEGAGQELIQKAMTQCDAVGEAINFIYNNTDYPLGTRVASIFALGQSYERRQSTTSMLRELLAMGK